jgi:Rhodopirellula transposase DDE domain
MSDMATIKAQFESLRPAMDERMQRLWAAAEVRAIGWGGLRLVAAATGLSVGCIRAGLRDLPLLQLPCGTPAPSPRPRAKRGGRRRLGGLGAAEIAASPMLTALEQMLCDDVAGDPMSRWRWVRCSLRSLSDRLGEAGYPACPTTVSGLLRGMGFSRRGNKRGMPSRVNCPDRDEQFRYISSQRQAFSAAGWPVVSVDTKKKELIGNFRNPGQVWCREAAAVDEHDFPSGAECKAVPFGVYDVTRNKGYVVVGVSHNTPEFAVRCIARWWDEEGRVGYPGTGRVLILADGGGGNGSRSRAWKQNLQTALCDRYGITATVCHYPPGASKWNPIEHRLFSQISRNWEGKPLRTLEIMLGYIRGTATLTGLVVTAHLDEATYNKGQRVSKEDLSKLKLERHAVCPSWNYNISPTQSGEARGLCDLST